MRHFTASFAVPVLCFALTSCAHNSASSVTRTISVSANETVSVESDLAILRIGFDTPPEDLKSAYADGSRRSNAIVIAVKRAGIPDADIRSECQYIERDWSRDHTFRVEQHWTVSAPPKRAAEILDIAIQAGANNSGQIEWTVKDPKTIENEALDRASKRATANAIALAQGMSVRLGSVVSVSNQFSSSTFPMSTFAMAGAQQLAAAPRPLTIEPHQVTRNATVNAVFALN